MSAELDRGRAWLTELTDRLPRHGRVVDTMRDAVERHPALRWFDVSCSLGAGLGDRFSDVDGAIGYAAPLADGEIEALGPELVERCGSVTDVLVHTMAGFPSGVLRVAAEYVDEVQLDLVLMPSSTMSGLRDREVALVDKDDALVGSATSSLYGPPDERLAREWTMLGWWWVSDIAKYLERDSDLEAIERIGSVRGTALQLYAASIDVAYPSFGLTSLLDAEPVRLPEGLAATYPSLGDTASLGASSIAVAELLDGCSQRAASHLEYDLSTGWSTTASHRLVRAVERIVAEASGSN